MVSGKPPRKLWKIGELVRHTGLSRQTIHNYVVLGLIYEEDRTESGHRLFSEAVWKQLAEVERLKAGGKTLGAIARLAARKRARQAGD
ncbi:MerR family transcriptional regulator [bacterium]|nr:MerR family transcriptional regulator [bacterium]